MTTPNEGKKTATMPSVEGLNDDEAAQVIINFFLDRLPDQNKPPVKGAPTPKEIVEHLRKKTHEGLLVIRTYRRIEAENKAREREKAENEQKSQESTGPLKGIRRFIADAIKKITSRKS